MRFRPACFLLSLLVFVGTATAQDTPRRDPQALAAVQQSLATMGTTVPRDSVPTGSITIVEGLHRCLEWAFAGNRN
jgi:hypothetical protein